ncbi:MAG: trigger factor [Desulfosarcinaceae bacterium]|nr:trigger factor [Desulfosarcinaceae bacterium]
MNVTVEEISSVKKVLHIEVPVETVKAQLDEAYNGLKKTAKIKGFRPGKAPRSVLERLYKKDVNADVTSRLIQESYVEALRETKLTPVAAPKVDPPELQGAEPLTFDAEIEIRPEIDDVAFKGIKLTKNAYAVTDEEMTAQLAMLQKNLAKVEPIKDERAVAEGDFVLVDYEGFKDGQPFEETQKTENFTLKVGDAYIAPAMDDGLVGMQPGEDKEIEVTFADDYFNAKLAGQTVTFTVHLHEIREQILPEIDDEMAKQLGPFDSLESLTAKIRENLTSGYEKRTEQELNEQIFTELLEKTEFEVPDAMVEMELEHILNDAERSFNQANKTFEEAGITRESLAEKYRPTAEKQVRRHLILGKIVNQESLEVTDEEVDEGLAEMAKTYQQPVDQIKSFYESNKEGFEVFKHTLLEKKAIKLIIEHSQIEEVVPEKEAASESPEDSA